jgi:hypothetical protein
VPPPEHPASALALGPRWEPPEPFEELAEIAGIRVYLAGFSARDAAGRLATGSAAGLDRLPRERAYFELLERTSILDALAAAGETLPAVTCDGRRLGTVAYARVFPCEAPDGSYRHSLSNGVAAGATWAEACEAARLELAERDRVLGSWYGHGAPEPLALGDRVPAAWRREYDFRLVRFPPRSRHAQDEVAGLVALPSAPDRPLASGFGAARDLDRASEHAVRECIQALGFLWGEPIPAEDPAFEASPDFHQATYLRPQSHARLRAWLDGAHARTPDRLESPTQQGERIFVDLTPARLRGELVVAKAIENGELPLTFGLGHPNLLVPPSDSRRVHPIC